MLELFELGAWDVEFVEKRRIGGAGGSIVAGRGECGCARLYKQALSGELGPSAKAEAQAGEWSRETALQWPFSTAEVRTALKTTSGNRDAAVCLLGQAAQKRLRFWSSEEPDYIALAKADEKVAKEIAGKQIVKTIVVPNKLVNIVVK